jgi:2-polyprenyl-6-methoxyphenol hydroxylase-like FAD-dependent oxidoreductase
MGSEALPTATRVLIAGGGPVGLAAAVELGRRGIECAVFEPRTAVSHARPRCKTLNVRTMEHLRRWGIADRLREQAPLPVSWSSDAVFCTSLSGRELSRFSGIFGLVADSSRFPELGQQAPQFVLEELLRDVVGELATCTLVTGASVTGVDQDVDGVTVSVIDGEGGRAVVRTDYVLGCDGPRSAVRDAIGSAYVGEHALRPNFGMVFDAPDLMDQVVHGPAVHYWTVNPQAPALMGPLDLHDRWWIIAFGVDRDRGEREGEQIIAAAAGVPLDAKVLSTDPWTARMQLVDRARSGRVFLAGDAAHLNPPFGGHGLNTGISDAVDLGWKLAAVLQGWGGPALLDSYEIERRPIQTRVIEAATENMKVLAADLLAEDLDADGLAGDAARRTAAAEIQRTKEAEFHALDLILDVDYESPIVVGERAGGRLPHVWLGQGDSLYDRLGPDMTLLVLEADARGAAKDLAAAAHASAVPLTSVDLVDQQMRGRFGAGLVLVRPDQHVAWAGDRQEDAVSLLERVSGRAGAVRGGASNL